MADILLTGPSGFIGKNLLSHFKSDNVYLIDFHTFGLVGMSELKPYLKDVNYHMVKNDISKEQYFGYDFKADCVFHFAAPSSIVLFNRDPVRCVRDTILGFRNILNYCDKTGAKLIYPSTGNIYGNAAPMREDIQVRPSNLYALSKQICETMAKDKKSVESVGFRIFAGYGPGEEHKGEIASAVTLFLDSMLKGESPVIWGDGMQTRDFIYIDDIIEALLKSMQTMTSPIINLGSGNSTSFIELVSTINKLLGTEIIPKFVPKPTSYVETTCADVTKLREELSIYPRDLKAGLKHYFERIQID